MVGAVIRALIYICFMVLAFYLVVWVLAEIGIAIPQTVLHIITVIFVLFALLILWQLFSPWVSGINWWGRPPGTPPA